MAAHASVPYEPVFVGATKQKLEALYPKYPTKQACLLPALWMVQEARGWIPEQGIAEVAEVLGLTPAYDMLPTRYAGLAGELFSDPLVLEPPTPKDASVWDSASAAAVDFWRAFAAEHTVSSELRRIATENAARVTAWRRLGALLPSR